MGDSGDRPACRRRAAGRPGGAVRSPAGIARVLRTVAASGVRACGRRAAAGHSAPRARARAGAELRRPRGLCGAATRWDGSVSPCRCSSRVRSSSRRSTRFPLEFGDILARHVTLAGTDPFQGAHVPSEDLRRACEVQAKSHLIHLARGLPRVRRPADRGGPADSRVGVLVCDAPDQPRAPRRRGGARHGRARALRARSARRLRHARRAGAAHRPPASGRRGRSRSTPPTTTRSRSSPSGSIAGRTRPGHEAGMKIGSWLVCWPRCSSRRRCGRSRPRRRCRR